jgi:hypothetical protein
VALCDDVFCNNDLFGEHKGEKHRTESLDAVFPGSDYEITQDGRLELLEATFEDRSDPNDQGLMRLAGIMTPVFTGARRDMDFHGWIVFPNFGRAKFTDGTLTEFVPDPDSLHEPESTQDKATHFGKTLRPEARRIRHQQLHSKSCEMTVLIEGPRRRQPRSIPFQRMLEHTNRGLDNEAKKEWVDDAERRLREVISRVDPRPTVNGYSIERLEDGLTIYTITAERIGKREIGVLSAGDWPMWNEIVEAVPEFDRTQVVFDAVSHHEWSRRWDLSLQLRRIQREYGIFA